MINKMGLIAFLVNLALALSGCGSGGGGGTTTTTGASSSVIHLTVNDTAGTGSFFTMCGYGVYSCSETKPVPCFNCDETLSPYLNSGIDSNGNYDTMVSWSGCPQVTGQSCYIPTEQNANVTATFSKVYGAPSNVSVQIQGAGKGYVVAYLPGAGIIKCGDGYTQCSGAIYTSTSTNDHYLEALADPNSVFAVWTGCPGLTTGNVCYIPAGQNANVTATFIIKP